MCMGVEWHILYAIQPPYTLFNLKATLSYTSSVLRVIFSNTWFKLEVTLSYILFDSRVNFHAT